MATFFKFNRFVTDLALGVHNLDTGDVKVYLSNAAPSATLDAVKADLAEIAGGNGYTAGGHDAAAVVTQNGAVMELSGTDITITAAGGTVGPFQYAVLYNDTPTSPADPVIGAWDYGSAITLQIGEQFTIDFGATIATLT
jgi:hypothetical protein